MTGREVGVGLLWRLEAIRRKAEGGLSVGTPQSIEPAKVGRGEGPARQLGSTSSIQDIGLGLPRATHRCSHIGQTRTKGVTFVSQVQRTAVEMERGRLAAGQSFRTRSRVGAPNGPTPASVD